MNIEISQIVTQIIAFLIVLWILKKFAWKPLLDLLEERHNKIKDEFEKINAKKKQISELHRMYQDKLKNINVVAERKAQKEVDKARENAKEILEEAHKKSTDIALKAQKASEKEISAARDHLKEEVVNLALAATEAVIGKSLNEKDQRELITQYIDEAKIK